MINIAAIDHISATNTSSLNVLEGFELKGQMNTDESVVLNNIRYSIRLGHPQLPRLPNQSERVALVCGGPSLATTEHELRQLVFEGAKVVTVNGSYQWCIERNIHPSAQIILDARPTNARFLEPFVPRCSYFIASQCDKAIWDAVEGRDRVGIWHSVSSEDTERSAVLDEFYQKRWIGVPGGTTVGTRAIGLLRTLGYLRFDIFGMDSCWLGDENHAFPQAENNDDSRLIFKIEPTDDPINSRTFVCSPWHVKQFEDFLQFVRAAGSHFALNVHGNGMIAYAMQAMSFSISVNEEKEIR